MKFGIITHAVHKIKDGQIYAYEPYVREMNLWAKYVDEIIILAPVSKDPISSIEVPYQHETIRIVEIPNFDITSFKNIVRSIVVIPQICRLIYKVMKEVNHIHLRCPGNVGLLGCLVQIFFPSKPKTAKYAGNWDPNSKQPLSYRLQKRLLANTFLTKNMKVLVYGDWPNQSKNILSFFTASYYQKEIVSIRTKNLEGKINFIFVGTLTKGKQPLLSVKVIQELSKTRNNIHLDVFGDGAERECLEGYIRKYNLDTFVTLHGNVGKEIIKEAFKKSHFLLFISRSEGWPKVVAEAMFWGVIPITSNVSCVSYMIGNGSRGTLVESSVVSILWGINAYFKGEKNYIKQSKNAMEWSQEFTLEKFESEIKKYFK